MIYTIDIGNSNIVNVVYDVDKAILFSSRDETIKANPEQGYFSYFSRLANDLKEIKISAVVVSCVVPSVTPFVLKALDQVFACEQYVLRAEKVGWLAIELENPLEIGSDLLATAIGSTYKYPRPCLIVDVGSATKITGLGLNNRFLGGVIIPGIGVSAEAMHRFIPQLPEVSLEIPKQVIGHTTIECIQSGLLYSVIESIKGVSRRMEAEIGLPCSFILTGGYSTLLKDELQEFTWDPNLLSDGLFYYYRMMTEASDPN